MFRLPSGWPRQAWRSIAVCYGLARFAYGLFLPVLTEEFGLDGAVAGTIASSSYIAYCVAVVAATAATAVWGPRAVAVAAGITAATGTGADRGRRQHRHAGRRGGHCRREHGPGVAATGRRGGALGRRRPRRPCPDRGQRRDGPRSDDLWSRRIAHRPELAAGLGVCSRSRPSSSRSGSRSRSRSRTPPPTRRGGGSWCPSRWFPPGIAAAAHRCDRDGRGELGDLDVRPRHRDQQRRRQQRSVDRAVDRAWRRRACSAH